MSTKTCYFIVLLLFAVAQVFAQDHFITIVASEHGKLSPSGPYQVVQGGQVTVSIVPDSGWRTDSVVVDEMNQGSLTTYMFQSVSADHIIRATFTKFRNDELEGPISSLTPNNKKVLTITPVAGAHGRVSPAGNQHVSQHGSLDFSIAADSGYAVDSVIIDGGYVGSLRSYSFTNVMYDHVLIATFVKKP